MSDETSLKQILKATFFECKQTIAAAMPDTIDLSTMFVVRTKH